MENRKAEDLERNNTIDKLLANLIFFLRGKSQTLDTGNDKGA